MKKTILQLVFIAFTTIGFGQSGAKIEFLNKDNTIDYGTVSKDSDNGLRTFEFKNTGDAPLIISNVIRQRLYLTSFQIYKYVFHPF